MNDILTLEETQAILRLTKQGMYRYLRRGEIPGAFKIGKSWRFSRAKIEKFAGCKIGESPTPSPEQLAA